MTSISEADRNEMKGMEIHKSLKGSVMINLPAKYRDRYQGVLFESVEQASTAWSLGLRSGDLITKVNQVEINNLKQLNETLARTKKEPMLSIYRNGRYYLLPLND